MKRSFRLTRSQDFKRVRRFGRSYAHPLIVLIVMQNESDRTRIGIAASSSVGKAVSRNRAKRLMREVIRPLQPCLAPGVDMVLLARTPMANANFDEVESAIRKLMDRAGLVKDIAERDR